MAEIKFRDREGAVSILRVLFATEDVSRPWIQGLSALGSVIMMISASACTAHSNAAPSSIGFFCGVDSAKMLSPAMSNDEVCALFKTKIDEALKPSALVAGDESAALPANWLKLEVRFSTPGTASATVTKSKSGKETVHPEIAVDVMDKAMGPSDVNMLADAVGQYLADAAKK
jgi:hypothetical protein